MGRYVDSRWRDGVAETGEGLLEKAVLGSLGNVGSAPGDEIFLGSSWGVDRGPRAE